MGYQGKTHIEAAWIDTKEKPLALTGVIYVAAPTEACAKELLLAALSDMDIDPGLSWVRVAITPNGYQTSRYPAPADVRPGACLDPRVQLGAGAVRQADPRSSVRPVWQGRSRSPPRREKTPAKKAGVIVISDEF